MGLLSNYFHNLAKGFTGGGSAIGDIDGTVQHLFTTVDGIIANVKLETDQLRNFKFDPKWKTRVINAPIAIQQTRDFVTETIDTVRDDFAQLKDDVDAVKEVFRQIKSSGAVSGIGGIVKVINEFNTFLETLVNAVDRFQNLVDMVRQIREEIEGLESIFLQQGNLRQIQRGPAKVRLGNLHA
jgi:archaellum component FlaC